MLRLGGANGQGRLEDSVEPPGSLSALRPLVPLFGFYSVYCMKKKKKKLHVEDWNGADEVSLIAASLQRQPLHLLDHIWPA